MRRYTTIVRAARAAGFALAAMVAVIALGATEVAAQGFNVVTFQCTYGGDVRVDVRGIGNTNVCVEGVFDVDADCACVNNGGNCPADAKKQSIETTVVAGTAVEPKNGRVNTTIDTSALADTNGGICSGLQSQCGGGQTARSITETVLASYTLCATSAAAGQDCTCEGSESLATASGGACDTSGVTFRGKKDSCLNLFQ